MVGQSWLPQGFDFLCGLPERKRKGRPIVALKAFLDDSGTKGSGKVLMFGGLLGTAEALSTFADDWDKELRAHIPLPIRYFKASEARSLKGEFNSWSRKNRDQKVSRLAAVVNRPDLSMILCGVELAPHAQLEQLYERIRIIDDATNQPIKHSPMEQPYLLAVLLAMFTITSEARRRNDKRVEVVIDDHVVFRRDALRFWEITRSFAADSVREFVPVQPLFRDDRDFVPLQAADLLMGHARMTVEKVSRWPELDLDNMKVFGQVAEARSLSQLAARQIERQLQLPPDAIRMRVQYPDGRDIDAVTGESDV